MGLLSIQMSKSYIMYKEVLEIMLILLNLIFFFLAMQTKLVHYNYNSLTGNMENMGVLDFYFEKLLKNKSYLRKY